jgi:hypothetical protein
MTNTVQPVNCVTCHKPYSGFFEIRRVDRHGKDHGSVRVCSLPCVVRWAYDHGVARGVALSVKVKSVLDEVMAALKGPPAHP